jgi:phosphatidylinositol 4-kinase A
LNIAFANMHRIFRWSFGGNRLQIKAEDKVLSDVVLALRSVTPIGAAGSGPYKSLQAKQDLLQILLENERSRLRVWLFPLEQERKHFIPNLNGKSNSDHTEVRDHQ